MRSQHVWKEKDADGRKREVRVTKFGGVWRFQAKFADEDSWTYYERPQPEDIVALGSIGFIASLKSFYRTTYLALP